MVLPSNVGEDFFQKKAPHAGTKNSFRQKQLGEVVLNWRTNDQSLPRFERSFINAF